MSPEVLKAHAATLNEWSDIYRNERVPGANEVAFLLARAGRIITAIADGTPLPPTEPTPPADEPLDEPRPG